MTFTEFAESKTKSKSSMVTRDTSNNRYIPRCSGTKIFPLLSLGWYQFIVVSGYLTRGSNANTHSITMNGNVSDLGLVIPLVTMPFLN